MIECRFVYKFNSGGSSDSLNQTRKVHAIPRVGEKIQLSNAESIPTLSVVKDVVHQIDSHTGEHEIIVYYGE